MFTTTDRALVEYNNAPAVDPAGTSPAVNANAVLSFRNITNTMSKNGFTPDTAIQGLHYCNVISGSFKARLAPSEFIRVLFNHNMTKFELNSITTTLGVKTFYQEVRVQPTINYLN